MCLENHYIFASKHIGTQTEAQTVPILITSASDLVQRETPLGANVTVKMYLKHTKNSLFQVVVLDCGSHLGQSAAADSSWKGKGTLFEILEYPVLEKTHKDHHVKLLALNRTTPRGHTMCLRDLSKRFLDFGKLEISACPSACPHNKAVDC